MNWFTDFLKAPLTKAFGQDEPGEEVATYNDAQVKAGIIHLRNTLANSDEHLSKQDYSSAFQMIRLKPQMDAQDIEEQVDRLLDILVHQSLITTDEKARVSRENLLASMTHTVIDNIENGDPNEILLNSIRFEQELRNPHLEVIHSSIENG